MIAPVNELSPETRIWVYTADRNFTTEEQALLKPLLLKFCEQWTAHDKQLMAFGDIYFDRFLVLMVDETHTDASGCSIDKSVRFLKEVESQLNIKLFERDWVGIKHNDRISFHKLAELQGLANEESIISDTLVATKKDFEQRFFIPAGESWVKRFLS